jgi:hypothetical protein
MSKWEPPGAVLNSRPGVGIVARESLSPQVIPRGEARAMKPNQAVLFA